MKKHNPDLPILIRECVGTPARAFARFGQFTYSSWVLLRVDCVLERGVESNVMLDGLDEKSVALKLSELIKSQS